MDNLWFSVWPADLRRMLILFIVKQLFYVVAQIPLLSKYISSGDVEYSQRVLCSWAAAQGYLSLLIWARAQGCPWDAWTCYAAACGGDLKILQWARAQGCPWDEQTCWAAAFAG